MRPREVALEKAEALVPQRGQNHLDSFLAADDMCIGDDISIGIDDGSRSDALLLSKDRTSFSMTFFIQGLEARDQYLHHTRGNLFDEGLHGIIELNEGFGSWAFWADCAGIFLLASHTKG